MAVTNEEIKEAMEKVKASMDGVKIHDSVKEEIAGSALVMECCILAARAIVDRCPSPGSQKARDAKTALTINCMAVYQQVEATERDVAVALYNSFVQGAMVQQQAANITIPPDLLRGRN